jgi:hypothetical protein
MDHIGVVKARPANPKHEIRNPKQIRSTKLGMIKTLLALSQDRAEDVREFD